MQNYFYIADGRTQFYQWDLDREMVVVDDTITELHFCNGTSDCSIVCTVADGKANVPNIVLQTAGNIRVYGYAADHTEVAKVYGVLPRTKPADYVYTETEAKRYETLESRIEALEENGAAVGITVNGVAPDENGNIALPVYAGEVEKA